MGENNFYVYILANARPTLYIGMTNNLIRRVWEHKNRIHAKSFTAKYFIDRLVYFEAFSDPWNAIIREKQLKNTPRDAKLSLIERVNPNFGDLYSNLAS
jgi:putative endonuclease